MPSTSLAVRSMPRSGIRGIFDRASQIPDAIHLEMGEPDFITPAHIRAAAADALEQGYTKYTPNAGLPELRRAAAKKITTVNQIATEPEHVVITSGAVGGLFSTLSALCNPGDGMILVGPSWPNYRMIADLLGLSVTQVRLDTTHRSVVDALRAAATPGDKVLILNSPSNPNGQVLTHSEVTDIVIWADERDLWIVSDEVYDQITFDVEVTSPAALSDSGNVVSIYSMSKTYAMTGWRVGYLTAAPDLVPLIERTLEPTISCVNAAAQIAAAAALEGPQDCVYEMCQSYRDRRDLVTRALADSDVSHTEPDGAFYVWIRVDDRGWTGTKFAHALLEDRQVAVTPGVAFGADYDDHIRVSVATAEPLLREGIGRLVDLLRS